MHMVLETRPWTVAERDRLPDDGNRYEVVDGELFVTPCPDPHHQLVAEALGDRLKPFVRSLGLGTVFVSPTDVIFSKRDVVIPDVVVYPFDRQHAPQSWKDAPKPILVVEVRSPTTWRRDIGPKRRLYVEREVPEYWIVDQDDRSVTVVRPGYEDVHVKDVLRWMPRGDASPDVLEIPLSEIFG
jgi:Uma2 family endonuclease